MLLSIPGISLFEMIQNWQFGQAASMDRAGVQPQSVRRNLARPKAVRDQKLLSDHVLLQGQDLQGQERIPSALVACLQGICLSPSSLYLPLLRMGKHNTCNGDPIKLPTEAWKGCDRCRAMRQAALLFELQVFALALLIYFRLLYGLILLLPRHAAQPIPT